MSTLSARDVFVLLLSQARHNTERTARMFHEISEAVENDEEVRDLQDPLAKHLFILAKALQLAQLRIAEFQVLTAAADLAGHFSVGVSSGGLSCRSNGHGRTLAPLSNDWLQRESSEKSPRKHCST